MYKLDFKKGREMRSNCQHPLDDRKQDNWKKKIYFSFIDYTKAFTMWITTNSGKFFKRQEYQTILPASWETCIQVKKQQLEPDME